jgi:hypothetical protein
MLLPYFRVEEHAKQDTSIRQVSREPLKMEETCSSETSVDFQQTTWHDIPEDRSLHNHRCESFKSYIVFKYCLSLKETEAVSYILVTRLNGNPSATCALPEYMQISEC